MCNYRRTHEVLRHCEGQIFKLMSERSEPDEWAEWLRAPLEQACRAGNPDLVDALLEAGAEGCARAAGEDGGSLLHAAASGGSERVVSAVLNAGGMEALNARDSNLRTPLQVAVRAGRREAAGVLISAGADLRSTMTEAILEGHERLAHDLLLAGSDVNQAELCYFRGTPLTFAAAKGYELLVRALLDKGADTSLTVIGSTALHLAVRGGHLSTAEVLLAAGMEVDPFDSNGQTALHIASTCSTNTTALIDSLVAAGADVRARHPTLGEGRSPLHAAAHMENCEAALALLQQHGADVDVADISGGRPLHDACKRMHPEMAELLLSWGADETTVDDHGNAAADGMPSVQEIHDWYGYPGYPGGGGGAEDDGRDDAIEQEMGKDLAKRDLLLALLARAPGDRAWRRRGFVVLCRALPERVRLARGRGADGYASSSSTRASSVGGKLARPKSLGAGGDTGGVATAAVAVGVVAARGAGAGSAVEEHGAGAAAAHRFDGVAAWLMELREEGLFRYIVCFL